MLNCCYVDVDNNHIPSFITNIQSYSDGEKKTEKLHLRGKMVESVLQSEQAFFKLRSTNI